MRHYATHTLEMGQGKLVTHAPREYLALVDIESYPSFVDKNVDHLDLMAHLYAQMKAMTAVAWGAPHKTVKLRFFATEEDRLIEQMARVHYCTTASGWIRTRGQLCLTSHDRILDCAAHRTHHVLREQKLPVLHRPQIFNVMPGVYSVLVLYHFPFPFGGADASAPQVEPEIHYSVLLRRYPFPTPRVAPVRLPGLVPQPA